MYVFLIHRTVPLKEQGLTYIHAEIAGTVLYTTILVCSMIVLYTLVDMLIVVLENTVPITDTGNHL